MIPIINDLLQKGNNVILGGDGDALQLLSNEFPELSTIDIPDIQVKFSNKRMIINLIRLIPTIIHSSFKEYKLLKEIIKNTSIDVIISDNRYGLWNKKLKSILVTHQLMIKLPKPFQILEYPVQSFIQFIISNFNECWIPDYPNLQNCLSGDLSHKYKIPSNAKYIGPLSRFKHIEEIPITSKFDIIAILSGPEPLRTSLENQLCFILSQTKNSTLIIQGKPKEKSVFFKKDNISTIAHLNSTSLKTLLTNTKLIICRSGYSSIMDLEYFYAKTVLIPTPGQTEQEYLADHLSTKYFHVNQKNIDQKIIDFGDL